MALTNNMVKKKINEKKVFTLTDLEDSLFTKTIKGKNYHFDDLMSILRIAEQRIKLLKRMEYYVKLEYLAIISLYIFTHGRLDAVLGLRYKDIKIIPYGENDVAFEITYVNRSVNELILYHIAKDFPSQIIYIIVPKTSEFYFVFEWLKEYFKIYFEKVKEGVDDGDIKEEHVPYLRVFSKKKTSIHPNFRSFFGPAHSNVVRALAYFYVVRRNLSPPDLQKLFEQEKTKLLKKKSNTNINEAQDVLESKE